MGQMERKERSFSGGCLDSSHGVDQQVLGLRRVIQDSNPVLLIVLTL